MAGPSELNRFLTFDVAQAVSLRRKLTVCGTKTKIRALPNGLSRLFLPFVKELLNAVTHPVAEHHGPPVFPDPGG